MLTSAVVMKRASLFAVLFSLTLAGFAQSTVLEKVWTTSPSGMGLGLMDARVNKLVTDIQKHHYRNDIQKLSAIFRKTHSRFLHQYIKYTGIEELTEGKYDCLTATSLFADILTRTGYNYNIIETNYHIFIVVNTMNGDVVLETTDRFGGFISDKTKMNKTIHEYQKNTLQAASPSEYKYTFSLYQSVDADQLAGLLYFNQAVKAFNQRQWAECSEKLSAASATTKSPRIAELSALLYAQSDITTTK